MKSAKIFNLEKFRPYSMFSYIFGPSFLFLAAKMYIEVKMYTQRLIYNESHAETISSLGFLRQQCLAFKYIKVTIF